MGNDLCNNPNSAAADFSIKVMALSFAIKSIALIKKTVEEKMTTMLENARTATSPRIIEDDVIIDLFDL